MLGQVPGREGKRAGARSTKGWRKSAPRLHRPRAAVYARCGAGAFLMPDPAKPGMSKFPIVGKADGCAPDCRALRAAYARAQQYGHGEVARKAKALGRRHACRWA